MHETGRDLRREDGADCNKRKRGPNLGELVDAIEARNDGTLDIGRGGRVETVDQAQVYTI